MANRKSAAAQAIKDMLELGLDIVFLTGNVNRLHVMNAAVGITTKEKSVKKVREIKVSVKIKVTAKVSYDRRSFFINPDGTISSVGADWDMD